MDVELLTFAGLVFLGAGIIKGTVGIGLPTIVISVLSMSIDPRLAMALALLPVLVTNFWQFFRAKADKRLVLTYWPFALMLVLFNYVFSMLSFAVDTQFILLALGVVVVLFAITSLISHPPPLPASWDRPAQFIAGGLAGVMGGLTTIWSPPMVIYLIAKRLDKETFVMVTGAVLTAGSLPLLASYYQSGLLANDMVLQASLLVLPTLIGMRIGEAIRHRVNRELFVKLLLCVFLLLGLNLIRRAVF